MDIVYRLISIDRHKNRYGSDKLKCALLILGDATHPIIAHTCNDGAMDNNCLRLTAQRPWKAVVSRHLSTEATDDMQLGV